MTRVGMLALLAMLRSRSPRNDVAIATVLLALHGRHLTDDEMDADDSLSSVDCAALRALRREGVTVEQAREALVHGVDRPRGA